MRYISIPVTMRTLLGLLCLSVLLTTVYSIQCETCPLASTCVVTKNNTCLKDVDGCVTLKLQLQDKGLQIAKDCMPKNECAELKQEVGKPIPPKYGSYPEGTIVKTVECSKAHVSSASILLVVSGLLAMRFLF